MALQKSRNNCPVQFDCGFIELPSYEITVTFNPQIWTRGSAYYEGIPQFEKELLKWLKPLPIDGVWIVVEYTKAHFPHLHCCVQSTESIPSDIRSGVVKGIQRLFGRATFKSVADLNAYEEYMQKDLAKNFDKTGSSHYVHYYRN